MKRILLTAAVLMAGCGTKPPLVQDFQDMFEQARVDLVNGGNWLFDRIKAGVDFTTEELSNCFSGGGSPGETIGG